jgi:ribosomal protein S18 acetylase RimI-like enzyme
MYSIEALIQQVKEQHIFLLAKEHNETIGYASYETHYKCLPKTKIHKIYLLPEAQGKQIGQSLLNDIAERATQQCNDVLTLNVNRDNSALHFYKKMGFLKIGEENIPIGNGYRMEDFIMEKKL